MKNTAYKIPIKERISFFCEQILNQFLKINAFQRYVNRKANNKYGMYLTPDGSSEIDDVFKDYRFNDIQKDDMVLDVGANVGGFSLFVSKFVKHVYAVEPITIDVLQKNIELNKINNITVFDTCLGKGIVEVNWMSTVKKIPGKSLSELIDMCGGHIDFLKCDCEGGEWCIKPEELKGIRRIEMEVHNFDGQYNLNNFLKMLNDAGFKYSYDSPRNGIMLVHAWRNNAGT